MPLIFSDGFRHYHTRTWWGRLRFWWAWTAWPHLRHTVRWYIRGGDE